MIFIQENMVFAHQLDVSCKKQLLTSLSKIMLQHVQTGVSDTDEAVLALATQLMQREHLGSTAIGRGVAMPHCVSADTDNVLCCIATSKRPIAFDAADGRHVDLFGMLLLPEALAHTAPAHLERLKQILTKRGLRSRLKSASSHSELKSVFINSDATPAATGQKAA